MVSQDDWCDYGDMPKSMCDHCRNKGKIPKAAEKRTRPDDGTRKVAAYESICVCGRRIDPGDMLAYSELKSAWVHEHDLEERGW